MYGVWNYYESDEKYEGKWRVLSTDGDNIKIVSAGVPLSFIHSDNNERSISCLTTNFFNTPIGTELYQFRKCGFKYQGELITDIAQVKSLFNNDYTAKNKSNNPEVRSMKKEDIDKICGLELESGASLANNDLLALPCENSESIQYAYIWLASKPNNYYNLWAVHGNGVLSYHNGNYDYGIRPVVTLSSDVSFKKASININDTTTWDFE